MAKARTYSARVLRSQWGNFLRLNRRRILVIVASEIAVIAVITAWLLRVYGADPFITYVLGALHAAAVTIMYFTLRVVFLVNDQGAVHQMRGDFGEINTRDELGRAKRHRLIWGWVDSITVAGGDIDHVVVTRRGGIVVIDSKWRSDAIAHDISRSAIAADRAAGRAKAVVRSLGYLERDQVGRRRAADSSITVTPLVVLWGPIRREVPAGARVEGVDLVAGPEVLSWLRRQQSDVVKKSEAKRLLADLEQFSREHRPVVSTSP